MSAAVADDLSTQTLASKDEEQLLIAANVSNGAPTEHFVRLASRALHPSGQVSDRLLEAAVRVLERAVK